MKKMFLLFTIVFTISNCATIMKGGKQTITVESNVKEATVLLDGKIIGTTKLHALVDIDSDSVLTIKKNGYAPQQVKMQTKMSPWFWGNIILGGTLGSSTDSSSGAIYEYAPDKYYVNLKPEKMTARMNVKHKKESQIRYFVLMNYDRINRDISVGKGEYLDSLYELYNTRHNNKSILTKLRKAQQISNTMVEFSDELVAIARI